MNEKTGKPIPFSKPAEAPQSAAEKGAPPPDSVQPPATKEQPGEAADAGYPVFCLNDALASLAGEENLFRLMVGYFFDEGPQRLAEMQTALGRTDAAAIARAAHRLIGTVAYLGARPVLQTLERLATAKHRDDLPAAVSLAGGPGAANRRPGPVPGSVPGRIRPGFAVGPQRSSTAPFLDPLEGAAGQLVLVRRFSLVLISLRYDSTVLALTVSLWAISCVLSPSPIISKTWISRLERVSTGFRSNVRPMAACRRRLLAICGLRYTSPPSTCRKASTILGIASRLLT